MLLLDSCTLLWLAGGLHDELSDVAVAALRRHADLLFVSSISAFEIGVKVSKGKITVSLPPREWFHSAVRAHGLHEIPVNGAVAAASTMLPRLHRDPCDRILIATSHEYGLEIVTPDQVIASYPDVAIVW